MNKEIKKLWVAALRSGQYKQGIGILRSPRNEFCCLGVLCNLHAQAHPEIAVNEIFSHEYLGARSTLPYQVMKWADLPESLGAMVTIGGRDNTLACFNDTNYSFKTIAKAINEQL